MLTPVIGEKGGIEVNYVVFGIHAFALSSLQFTQIFMYYRGEQTSINLMIVLFLVVIALIMFTFFITEIFKPTLD